MVDNTYTVTELDASTGAFVKELSNGPFTYTLIGADAISSDGTHVWVATQQLRHRGGRRQGPLVECDLGGGVRVQRPRRRLLGRVARVGDQRRR